MQSVDQLRIIAKQNYTLFFKYGCKYSKAAMELLQKLKETGVIDSFELLILGDHYDEKGITTLCEDYGIHPSGYNTKVTIPQVFMKGEYIGGNDKFYGSRWNTGDEDSGSILLYDADGTEHSYPAPGIVNPTTISD
jgi:glutaredoxin-related protein